MHACGLFNIYNRRESPGNSQLYLPSDKKAKTKTKPKQTLRIVRFDITVTQYDINHIENVISAMSKLATRCQQLTVLISDSECSTRVFFKL